MDTLSSEKSELCLVKPFQLNRSSKADDLIIIIVQRSPDHGRNLCQYGKMNLVLYFEKKCNFVNLTFSIVR